MDRFEIIFSPRSERDLKSITFYVAQRSSLEIAARFGNSLIDRALTLKTLPMRGRVVPEIGDPNIREIIFKSYRIVYRTRGETVEVLRFWHASNNELFS